MSEQSLASLVDGRQHLLPGTVIEALIQAMEVERISFRLCWVSNDIGSYWGMSE
jgi:hypothetical protein